MSSKSLHRQQRSAARRIRSRLTMFSDFGGDTRTRARGARTALTAALAVTLMLGGVATASAAPTGPITGPTAGGTTVTGDVPAGVSLTQISAGINHTVALGDDGNTYAWGFNGTGELGDGANTDSNLPVRVQTPVGVTFTQISAGSGHTAALGSDGNTYTWGDNWTGQLGDGTKTSSNTPVRVQAPASVAFTQISAGSNHTAALGNDGNTYTWGDNSDGQLGDGTKTSSNIPVQVQAPASVAFTQIIAAYNHSVALGDDGHTYAWGDNLSGQLGDGTNTSSNIPVQVHAQAGVTFTQISAGSSYTAALGDDGNAYTWGDNWTGQLGNRTNVDSNIPVRAQAPIGVTFTQISANLNIMAALGNDGKAYTWGNNSFGQLGNGTNVDSNIPVQVQAQAGVAFTRISVGSLHMAALGADGNTYAWGENSDGRLGDRTNIKSNLPVQVVMDTKVTSVSFGGVAGTNLLQTGNQWTAVTPSGCGIVTTVVRYALNGGPVMQKTLADGFTYGTVPTVTTQPVSVTGAAGSEVTMVAASSGDSIPTVAWESSTDAGAVWAAVPLGTTPSLKVTVTDKAVQYRAVFTNCNGNVTTATASVTPKKVNTGNTSNTTTNTTTKVTTKDPKTTTKATTKVTTKDPKTTTKATTAVASTTADTGTDTNSLASTGGVPGWPWLTAAGILLIAGTAVVITAARRRDRTQSL